MEQEIHVAVTEVDRRVLVVDVGVEVGLIPVFGAWLAIRPDIPVQ